jgi:hypothetical protein
MSGLSKQDKEVILDFYFHCGDEEHINCGRDLIAAEPEAAELYSKLEDTLTQLDSIKYEPCPDNLAELTVARLKLAASSGQSHLESLLAIEQQKNAERERLEPVVTTRPAFWRVLEMGAVAALIMFALSTLTVSWSNARAQARQTACQYNLGKIATGLNGYTNDYNGFAPSVASVKGAPWWKVGQRGEQNSSNTRNPWLLVKNDYAKPADFICPGRKKAESINFSPGQLAELNDFPSPLNISYSYIFMCDKAAQRFRSGNLTVLMSDANPLFEKVFDKYDPSQACSDEFAKVVLDRRMLQTMSANHRGKGQNVLIRGGSAAFQDRRIILNDDIFTVKGINSYEGREMPCDPDDTFLVP